MHGRRLASLCCMRDIACALRVRVRNTAWRNFGTPFACTLEGQALGMRGFCQDIAKRHSDFDRSRLTELEHKKLDDPRGKDSLNH